MSTLRLSVGLLFLMLLLGLVGCSSTAALRSAASPKIRTVASIGDRPLPMVTGEPGDTMVAEKPLPERPSSRVDAEGRISGRVVDERGEPIAEARVRLAVGSAPGGRVIDASTDRAGGFTLHGLRPGTPYTVIAEYEDDRGVMTGRSDVEAPDADVRIALAPIDAGTRDPVAEAPISRVSRRDLPGPEEEETGDEEITAVIGTPINVEDLPPAPEAESFTSASTSRRPEEEPGPGPGPAGSAGAGDEGWRRGRWTSPAVADHGSLDGFGDGADGEPRPAMESRSRPDSPAREFEQDDEGPNPLPPAIEPGQASRPPRRKVDLFADRPEPIGERAATLTGNRDGRPATPEAPPPGALVAVPPSSLPSGFAEVPESTSIVPDLNDDHRPATVVAADEELPPPLRASGSGRPVRVAANANEELLPPPAEANGSAPTAPVAANEELLPPPAEASGTDRPGLGPIASNGDGEMLPPPVEAGAPATPSGPGGSPSVPEGSSRPRPRWGDLAAIHSEPPPLEAEARKAAASEDGEADPGTARLVRGSPREPDSYCRFDPRTRRIEDFRLPDLEGRLVRFQDFDSDLILLDFWGTWCQPCLRSVPHLVDLQRRIGDKQLRVVGIACEREELSPADRVAGVAKTVQKLGVNYPVLVSSLDGSCPLQKALNVQAYPTLILIDRQGRILWQDQGATRTTLARLDRMLTLATRSDGRRRY